MYKHFHYIVAIFFISCSTIKSPTPPVSPVSPVITSPEIKGSELYHHLKNALQQVGTQHQQPSLTYNPDLTFKSLVSKRFSTRWYDDNDDIKLNYKPYYKVKHPGAEDTHSTLFWFVIGDKPYYIIEYFHPVEQEWVPYLGGSHWAIENDRKLVSAFMYRKKGTVGFALIDTQNTFKNGLLRVKSLKVDMVNGYFIYHNNRAARYHKAYNEYYENRNAQ